MSKKLRNFLWPLTIVCSLCLLSSLAYITESGFLELMELRAFDLRLKARGKIPASGKVAIIAIDEKSLEKIGRWPWSRDIMADLAAKLGQSGALGIGYDISFFDRQSNAVYKELKKLAQSMGSLNLLPNPALEKYFQQRLTRLDPDKNFANALSSSPMPQVLGYYFNLSPQTNSSDHTLNSALRYPLQKKIDQGPVKILVPKAFKARTNIPVLATAAYGQAYFNIIPDADGTIRHYNMVLAYEQTLYQPLGASLAAIITPDRMPAVYAASYGLVGVEIGSKFVHTDSYGRMLLNYRGPAQSIKHIPAWKILQNKYDIKQLQDKLLLIGVTAPAVYDLRVTPFGVAYPGLEVQATALDNILQQDYLFRPDWASLFDALAIWALGICCLLFLWQVSPFWTLSGFILLFVGYIYLNYYFFVQYHFWLNIVYPLGCFALCYLALNIYRFLFADRQKRMIRSAFGKYLDQNVVKQVVADPQKLQLGGVKLELTVLFSDIRGFTTLSEGLEPEELVQLLNEYLTEMTRIVLAHQGLLDKYIGDALMAVFGAPQHYPEHAVFACRSALAMTSRLTEMNLAWRNQGRPELAIGVGLNSGPMVAGNMGSLERFDYTVMGDNVNLGSRLEGLNKVYGTQIIISSSTLEKIQDLFWVRSLDLVRVKGKEHPVEIFELLDEKEFGPCPLSYIAEYNLALKHYREARFEESILIFNKLYMDYSLDKVLELYIQRLKTLIQNPPAKWDGVCIFTTK